MADVLYIAGHNGAGAGKVWKWTSGGGLVDISTGITATEVCSLYLNATTGMLYAGGDDGKIYTWIGGAAWTTEYDTGAAVRVCSLTKLGTNVYALRSSRPNVDVAAGVTLWRQDGLGVWTSIVINPPITQTQAVAIRTLTGADGTFMLLTTYGAGVVYYSANGTVWAASLGLSQAGDPLSTPQVVNNGGSIEYAVSNADTGNSWGKTTMAGPAWTGWGRPIAVPTVDDLCYGNNATLAREYPLGSHSYYFLEHKNNRVYRMLFGTGWQVTEGDLDGGNNRWRAAFANLAGTVYVVYERTAATGFYERNDGTGAWAPVGGVHGGANIFIDALAGMSLPMMAPTCVYDGTITGSYAVTKVVHA